MSEIPETTVDQLPTDAVILDVREDDEWEAGHAKGATHIPVAEVPQRLGEVPEADTLYVVCRGGGRSSRVTAWLNDNGFQAVNVAGGMQSWKAAGKPMHAENGKEPEVI
ncbi:rhodanese-like domain-containing protein [Epidermidibacterium keratini]|uniref:Rhodanese-like domain-containing protein n=1 Tax=Epidermidibacterium keratini TaxID=1891644 RepID=A0A7L4YPL0_9ACTN|nr:rhodanese-like domain-containing protein [Epidermidibacterium keratini]QHC00739.1 rhodanese-like domain-containing protein [Epidermidibacterium keratini]